MARLLKRKLVAVIELANKPHWPRLNICLMYLITAPEI